MHPERIKELILEVSPKWEDLQDLFAEITLNVKNHELISEGISAGIIQSRVRSVSNLRKRTGIDFNSIPEDRYSETWRIDFIKNNSNYNFFKNVEHLSTEHPVKSPKSIILTHEDDDILIIDDVSKYNEGKIRKYYIITAIWKILKSRSDDNTSNIKFLR